MRRVAIAAALALVVLGAAVPAPARGDAAHHDGPGHGPGPAAAEPFRDCPVCPEMVEIPAGTYLMGSEEGRPDEAPVRAVTIPEPLAAGIYEVTFAEWEACVEDGACPPLSDEGWGRTGRPVIGVTWAEAVAYTAWLSRVSGRAYRLPTEAEWEYLARAGTRTRYWWGESAEDGGGAFCGSESDIKRTLPVGSFAANPFGLHDVHGNVWEWVADCYRADAYARAQSGAASAEPAAGGTCQRVLRGGSWQTYPLLLRAARRFSADPLGRYSDVGFRVVRPVAATAANTTAHR